MDVSEVIIKLEALKKCKQKNKKPHFAYKPLLENKIKKTIIENKTEQNVIFTFKKSEH